MGKALLAFLLLLTLSLSGAAVANDDKVTICHHTGSQSNPTVTITVSENAWEAHQKHGDTRGPCPGTQPPVPTGTSTATARPTGTDKPSGTSSAAPTARATNAPTSAPSQTAGAPAPTANPVPVKTAAPTAPVKQLPSTATEIWDTCQGDPFCERVPDGSSAVPYDPGFPE